MADRRPDRAPSPRRRPLRSALPGSAALAAALLLTGCASLIPDYFRPAPPVAPSFPGVAAEAQTPLAADIAWQDHFRDERLKRLIGIALAGNRDLRIAALNIEQARALVDVGRLGSDSFSTWERFGLIE